MHWPLWILWALSASAALPSDIAWTNIVWTNIGIGSYTVGSSVGLERGGRNFQLAVAVKPFATFNLAAITLPLSLTRPPGALKLALAADENGAPGAIVETYTITGIQGTPNDYSINSALHPQLIARVQYWIVAEARSQARITWWNTSGNYASEIGHVMASRELDRPWSLVWLPDAPGVSLRGTSASDRASEPRPPGSVTARLDNKGIRRPIPARTP